MNTRKLAQQAVNYLKSLNGPLPENSDKAWYHQNSLDYQALLTLNEAGFGATDEELEALINAPKLKARLVRVFGIGTEEDYDGNTVRTGKKMFTIEIKDRKRSDEYIKAMREYRESWFTDCAEESSVYEDGDSLIFVVDSEDEKEFRLAHKEIKDNL